MGDILEQLSLAPEGCDERGSALHRSQSSAGVVLELPEVLGAEVRHGMVLQIPPDALNGIEFYCKGLAAAVLASSNFHNLIEFAERKERGRVLAPAE